MEPCARRPQLLGAVALTVLAGVLAACAPGVGLEALRTEPVLDSPGVAASELARGERRSEAGIFLGPTSGYVRVVHASPEEPEALIEHYREVHNARYSFVVNDRYMSASGSGTATLLNGRRGEVRTTVRVDTAAPTGPGALEVPSPPPDTATIVTVIVQSP